MSYVIYKYTCEFCKEFYIGKTWRQLRCRICEHQGLTIRTGKPCEKGGLVFSEVRDHCQQEHNQQVNPDNFEIVTHLRYKSDLETLDSLYQRSLKPKIINKKQSVPLLSYNS